MRLLAFFSFLFSPWVVEGRSRLVGRSGHKGSIGRRPDFLLILGSGRHEVFFFSVGLDFRRLSSLAAGLFSAMLLGRVVMRVGRRALAGLAGIHVRDHVLGRDVCLRVPSGPRVHLVSRFQRQQRSHSAGFLLVLLFGFFDRVQGLRGLEGFLSAGQVQSLVLLFDFPELLIQSHLGSVIEVGSRTFEGV